MRLKTISALSISALIGGLSGAMACEAGAASCMPSVVTWPLYTENGRRVGTIEARVKRLPDLEVSRSTGQSITVIYDNPGSRPGSIDPYMHLVPLPHARRSDTVGAYPVGY